MKGKIIAAIIAVCIIFPCLCWSLSPAFALAEETIDVSNYTDVLEDLQNDETFNVDDYPARAGDYAIEVFQIAESSDGELFVYVYQHTAVALCHATSINISKSIGDNLHYVNYKLDFLNEQDTLAKYLVRDFEVDNFSTRYYDISSIYRKWNSQIDKDEDRTTENNVSERAFAVGMRYELHTENGEIELKAEKQDVLEVANMYAGTLLYKNGLTVWGALVPFAPTGTNYVTSYYVAFSIDNSKYVIDKLFEADVGYSKVNWTIDAWVWELFTGLNASNIVSGEPQEGLEAKLKSEDYNKVSGLFGATYEWARIQKVSDFIADPDVANQISDDIVKDMKNGRYQYVLRFYEDEYYVENYGPIYMKAEGTKVYDVSIMRLKFMMGTKTYNLGVVSNKSSVAGARTPFDDVYDFFDKIGEFFTKVGDFFIRYWWAFAAVAGIIILGILARFIEPFRGALKVGLTWTGKGIYYAISALPRLAVLIGEKIHERRYEGVQHYEDTTTT